MEKGLGELPSPVFLFKIPKKPFVLLCGGLYVSSLFLPLWQSSGPSLFSSSVARAPWLPLKAQGALRAQPPDLRQRIGYPVLAVVLHKKPAGPRDFA